MAKTVVSINGPGKPFKENSTVNLNAVVRPTTVAVEGWKWQSSATGRAAWADLPGQTSSTYSLQATHDHKRWVRAVATINGQHVPSDPYEIIVGAATGSPPAGETSTVPKDEPAEWHNDFAICAFVVAAIVFLAFLVVSRFTLSDLGLSEAAYNKLDGRGVVGARLIGPIAVVGVLTVLIGLWMTVTEWRGRFAGPTKAGQHRGAGEDATKLIEALGKLKGATLVLVSGVLILLCVAWMTSSTTGSEPASATTTTTV